MQDHASGPILQGLSQSDLGQLLLIRGAIQETCLALSVLDIVRMDRLRTIVANIDLDGFE